MESLGTDLVDKEIGIFGVKAVAEEVGNVKTGLIGDGDLPKWGLGPFHSFHGFHSHILLHQIEVFDWPDPAIVG